jgi:hypothetical protein
VLAAAHPQLKQGANTGRLKPTQSCRGRSKYGPVPGMRQGEGDGGGSIPGVPLACRQCLGIGASRLGGHCSQSLTEQWHTAVALLLLFGNLRQKSHQVGGDGFQCVAEGAQAGFLDRLGEIEVLGRFAGCVLAGD